MSPKARKVGRAEVKYDLAMGKPSGEIARQWGVSRQYISSIRQEMVKEGILKKGKPGRPAKSTLSDGNGFFDSSDMSDIKVSMDKIQSMITKMRLLEDERNHYKRAFEEAVNQLSLYANIPSDIEREVIWGATAEERPSPWLLQKHSLAHEDIKEKQT